MSGADEELLSYLQLNLIPGIGPKTLRSLLDHLFTPQAVLAANIEKLQMVPGVGPKLARAIVDARGSDAAVRELERCRAAGVKLYRKRDSAYPRMLAEIPDPPNVLYCSGTLEERDNLAVGIVGSRRCTLYGMQQAERLAGALARAGVTVVSGLARGIDAAAHRGAIKAEGRTIAVFATGLGSVYPPEHVELADQVADHGALVSEFSFEQQPISGLFPQRNRIISGLSLGVIVIEAPRNSGALHTARHAMEQGREVFAVPGRIDNFASEGCHDLIRDGAALVRGPEDVLEALGPLTQPVVTSKTETVHTPRELILDDQERTILNLVQVEPGHIDDILRAVDLDSSRVLATLTILEMKRLIRRLPGGYLVRAPH